MRDVGPIAIVKEIARAYVKCDVCRRPPEQVRVWTGAVALQTDVVTACSHGAHRLGSVEWARVAKREVRSISVESFLLHPSSFAVEVADLLRPPFFWRGFSKHGGKRKAPRRQPAFERRMMRVILRRARAR
jgi:hypothetical protein